jgi:hypothetical protein
MLLVAPGQAAAGGIGLRLLDVPVKARSDPRAQLYVTDHLAPGTVVRRRIQVSNSTGSAVRVALYSAAATVKGGSFLAAAGRARNELSTWTSVRPGTAKVAARANKTAVVTVAIPRDAAPGERYGVVWAEVRSEPGSGGGITEVSRVGIRLYVSVGPGGPPAAGFAIESLTAASSDDGRPMVRATVRNTGGRALDISGSLRLRDGPGGLTAGPFPANLGVTLAIGDTEPVTVVLDRRVPVGPWRAQITLRSGLLERSKAATITFPGDHESSSHLGVYLAGAAGLLLLAGAGQVVLRRRRRVRLRSVLQAEPRT